MNPINAFFLILLALSLTGVIGIPWWQICLGYLALALMAVMAHDEND